MENNEAEQDWMVKWQLLKQWWNPPQNVTCDFVTLVTQNFDNGNDTCTVRCPYFTVNKTSLSFEIAQKISETQLSFL